VARKRNSKRGHGKRPRIAAAVSSSKTPSANAPAGPPPKKPSIARCEDPGDANPVWSLAILDLDGAFGWQHLRPDQLEALLARLRDLEKLTWNEILVKGKRHNHHIPMGNCSKTARKRLRELKLDDIDDVLSLRINSRARVIGILDGFVARVLWWDPEHKVCPTRAR